MKKLLLLFTILSICGMATKLVAQESTASDPNSILLQDVERPLFLESAVLARSGDRAGYGLQLGVGYQFRPVFGLGIGAEYARFFPGRNQYFIYKGKIRGYLDQGKTLYYNAQIGGGPQYFRGDRDNNRKGSIWVNDLELGFRFHKGLIIAGGFSSWRSREERSISGQSAPNIRQGNVLTLKLIASYDNWTQAEIDPFKQFYFFATWGIYATGPKNYPGIGSPSGGDFTGHVGGGIKVRPHLGIGVGLNGLSYATEQVSNQRRFQGVGIHAMGIWKYFTALLETGYAIQVEEGYGGGASFYYFNPLTKNGSGPYVRASIGPKFDFLTLQASYLTTPNLRGTEVLSTTPFSSSVIERQNVSRRFSGWQVGVGIFFSRI